MRSFMGSDLQRSVASLLAATVLAGSLVTPLPALAFSELNTAPGKTDTAGAREKPVEQALEAPSKGIPMPDPLINNQAGQGAAGDNAAGKSTTDSKSVEILFDINKAPEAVRKLRCN